MAVLNSNGFFLEADEALTRGDVAQALYQANLLKEDAPGMRILRAQK